MNKSKIELRQPEPKLNSDSNVDIQQVSPTCPKPIVSGCSGDVIRTRRHMSANIEGMLRNYKKRSMDRLITDENGREMSDAKARSAGTNAEQSANVDDTSVSQTIAKPNVGRSTVKDYFLCSGAVVDHFPELEKSKMFKSGYEWDSSSEYYVVSTNDYKRIEKYFHEVIEPFNEKSNTPDVDFWLRPCCDSLIDISGLTKNYCREVGVIIAIENKIGLTTEKNVAFAIYALATKYNYSPIQFINMVVK